MVQLLERSDLKDYRSIAISLSKSLSESVKETLPEEIQAIFEAQRDRYGFVHPDCVGYSLNPDHLQR